jgi:serine protease
MIDGDKWGKLSRRSFLTTIGVVGSSTIIGSAAASDGPGQSERVDHGDGELVVGLDRRVRVADAEVSIQSALPSGANVVDRNDAISFLSVSLPDGASVRMQSSVASTLNRRRDVAYVEPNSTYYPMLQPNDPRFNQQYAPQMVNAPEAWDTTLGSENVTIGVIDQGVQYTHPDLQAQFGPNKGRDFVSGDSDPAPTSAQELHGTHVSGIASATTNNGTGVAGISNSRLLSARCLSRGGGSLTAIANGITWVTNQGADLINMSIGGGGGAQTLARACQYALNNGALPIAAAGNSGTRGVAYPAAFQSVVAVSAVNSNGKLARFSQYGSDIEVTAPGVQVLSTVPFNGYQNLSGTSMACPATTGVAALGLAADPSMSPQELRQFLKETARDIGLSRAAQGAGLVDAAALVETVGGGGGDDGGGGGGDDGGGGGDDGDDGNDGGGGGGGCNAPAYNASTLYQVGDRVTYQGALWEATLNTRANAPDEEGDPFWKKIHNCN